MKSEAIFPGSFDPVTNGHIDLIRRSLGFLSHLTIAIGGNINKNTLFSIQERQELLEKILVREKLSERVSVESFEGLLIDYMKQKGANLVLRGMRAITDFELEFQMAHINKTLKPDLETIMLFTSNQNSFISSSMVKEIAAFQGDIRDFVPPEVVASLQAKGSGV